LLARLIRLIRVCAAGLLASRNSS